jgi:hypothetical protein
MRTNDRPSINPAHAQRLTLLEAMAAVTCGAGKEKATDLNQETIDEPNVQLAGQFFPGALIAGWKCQPH